MKHTSPQQAGSVVGSQILVWGGEREKCLAYEFLHSQIISKDK